MRGRERAKKKHLKQAGWRIVDEAHEAARGFRLRLRGPTGEEVSIAASSRPLAYRRAERRVLGRREGEAPSVGA